MTGAAATRFCVNTPATTAGWSDTTRAQSARAAADALRSPAVAAATFNQGLTLVHFSAQLERFLWDRGCAQGVFGACLRGVLWGFRGYLGVVQGVFRGLGGIRGCAEGVFVSEIAQVELSSERV